MADTDTSKINYSSGYTYNPESWQQSSETSTSTTNQASETQRQLNAELLSQILAGLTGQMTDEEISAFAENLLRPQLNAEIEASQQTYETTRLAKEQEIANLASELQRAIDEQSRSYRQSMADVDSAALARGMGRSSYTLQTLANQGGADAIFGTDPDCDRLGQLTDESARQSAQLQSQITQAAQQNAQTQARLNADYAANLAAKVQELRQTQKQEYNQNYMTAVSEALGSKTTNDSTTTGSGTSSAIAGSASAPAPVGGSTGSSGTETKKKTTTTTKTTALHDDVDVMSYG